VRPSFKHRWREGGTHHSSKKRRRKKYEGSVRGERVDEQVTNTGVCVRGSRAHVEVLAKVAKYNKKGKNMKFKVFPSSDQ
jgi:hypothetical protein